MVSTVSEDLDVSRSSKRRQELLGQLIEIFAAEGFLHLSLEDMARRLRCSKSTLYAVAESKEEIIAAVVRAFFRNSTESVEIKMAASSADPAGRIGVYLVAISEELAPLSRSFFDDVDQFLPARDIYERNTAVAAQRVRELVISASSDLSCIDPVFVGAVAGLVMAAIQRGRLESATGLDSAASYRALADLIAAGVRGA